MQRPGRFFIVMQFILVLISLLSLRTVQSSVIGLDLGGDDWIVTSGNGSVSCGARVPGGIYTDLMRAKVIGDPYFRDNDLLYKWIGRDNWNFTKTFQVSEDLLLKSKIQLVCHGLDTVAAVFLNGVRLGDTDNMFVRYTFDVKPLLTSGDNVLRVAFRSPVEVAKERHETQLRDYVIPPTCPVPVQNGECHINYLRKIQSSFSWDWGPSFPTQGIWKKIELEAFDSAVMREAIVTPRPYTLDNWASSSWELNTRVFLDQGNTSGGTSNVTSGNLKVDIRGQTMADLNQTLPRGQPEVLLEMRIRLPQSFDAELWWPAGYGEQPLYDVTLTYTDFSTQEVTSKSVRVGFRTVELVQSPIANSTGLSFYIRVNGVPIFGKGSNWIPADALPERSTDARVRDLLQSAVAANMNMLRVWGGGAYESDVFYDMADELGILIWHDLMFACSLYPASPSFMKSVTLEVKQQIRRLQNHPSIFLWAGNNENEAAIAQAWWPVVLQRPTRYRDDYVSLYVNVLRPLVMAEDPDRTYLPSSPSNGPETRQEGWISTDPQNEFYGDVHYYNYGNDGWDWRIYPQPRFASEYGFQSYPSFTSLANVSLPEDWYYPRNQFLAHRQHHSFGDFEIQASVRRHMNLPTAGLQEAFENIIYLSQITQAMSVKAETEHYRRGRSSLQADGRGLTMGALYWQLNDIWPAPSWASIEYGGKWKMLHYFARNFFAPVLVSPFLEEDNVYVYVVSDLLRLLSDLTLRVYVFKWDSFAPACIVEVRNYTQHPQSALRIFGASLDGPEGLLAKGSCQDRSSCFLYMELSQQQQEKQVLLTSNFQVLAGFNEALALKKANILVSNVTSNDNQSFIVELTSDSIAPYVWLETRGLEGEFSDNGFLLVYPTVRIYFRAKQPTTTQEVLEKLTVKSLMDVKI